MYNLYYNSLCNETHGLLVLVSMHTVDVLHAINSSPPGQNGHHPADDIFRRNLVDE